jgi:hypothetical protein
VPPYQWYYVAPIVSLSVVFVVALGALGTVARGRGTVRAVALAPAIAIAAATVLSAGYLDGHRGLPWKWAPIIGNWATAADYARVGHEIGASVGGATVQAPPEIGTLAYFCECAMVDGFSDRGRVIPLVDTKIAQAGALSRRLLELNYRWLDRTRLPRPVDYELQWSWAPLAGPGTWHLWSPATGDGYLRLVPVHR